MDNAALIDHGSGVTRSVSEIPLVGSISRGSSSSLSSASSSATREPAAASNNPSGGGDGNGGGPATAGRPVGTTSSLSSASPPRPRRPVPSATEDNVSKLDLAIMACSVGLVVPMIALNIKDLTSSWETPLKVLYGVLMILSLASTVTGFFTAWCPAVSGSGGRTRTRRLSPTCARFGLADAAALFIVFLACKLGRFGCAAGVGSAALVVFVLAVAWAWSELAPSG